MTRVEDDDVARRAALSQALRFDDFRPLSASVTVDIAAASQRGQSRSTNEDHYLVARFSREQHVLETSLALTDLPNAVEERAYAMLVADGLGGTGRGAVASRVALSTMAHVAVHFGKWHVRIDPQVAAEVMDRAEWFYSQVDRAVLARSRNDSRLSGMATTLTLAYSAGNDLFVANVGHSRAYLFRDGILTPLTRDHTLAQHFVDTGGPAPVDRGIQDLQHILTDAIGGDFKSPAVEVEHFFLVDGDWLLLCTNGLTDAVSEDEIADLLALRRGAAEQCRLLLELARNRGADDNATVITAGYRIPGSPPRPFLP
jgi:protein phosphatase